MFGSSGKRNKNRVRPVVQNGAFESTSAWASKRSCKQAVAPPISRWLMISIIHLSIDTNNMCTYNMYTNHMYTFIYTPIYGTPREILLVDSCTYTTT